MAEFCKKCGAPLQGRRFCMNCGTMNEDADIAAQAGGNYCKFDFRYGHSDSAD